MKIDISQVKNTPIANKSDIKSKELSTDETNKLMQVLLQILLALRQIKNKITMYFLDLIKITSE